MSRLHILVNFDTVGKIHILQKALDLCKLPENGKLVDKNDQLPHHLAVAANTPQSEAVLKLLFQYNFNLETKNKSGKTALECCRKDREDFKKLFKIEAEIDKEIVIVKSTYDNDKDTFNQKEDYKQATTVATISSKEIAVPHKDDEVADESDNEMSADELTELIKEKVDHVLKTDDRHWLENSESVYKPKGEPQKTANSVPTGNVIAESTDSKEINKEWKKIEECTWEVECTEAFWKELAKQEKFLIKETFNKLSRLANGEWHEEFHKPLSGTKIKNLYELKLTKSIRIIWELAIAYSPRLSSQNKSVLYTEIIRVWSLVVNHDHINKHVQQIERANTRGQQSVIKKKLSSCDQNDLAAVPRKRIPRTYQAKSEDSLSDNTFFPPASTKEDGYNVEGFYTITDEFIEGILNHGDRRDFPYKEWPKENEIISLSTDRSILLLGRSGTGKTTCCLYRLWNHFRTYWKNAIDSDPQLPRISLNKSKLYSTTIMEEKENEVFHDCEKEIFDHHFQQASVSTKKEIYSEICKETSDALLEESKLDFAESYHESSLGISCKSNETTEINEATLESDPKDSTIYDHLQPVFITKNSVLSSQFKRKFYDMAQTVKCLKNHLVYESMKHPYTLQNLNPHAYPLFLTSYKWLHLLDASLEDNKPFFPRNPDGSLAVKVLDMEYHYDEYAENLIMLDESASEDEEEYLIYTDENTIKKKRGAALKNTVWQKVDATYFCEELWQKITKDICNSKKINPLLVWIEIKSFIKGSSQALLTTDGYLSFDKYCKLGRKIAPDFVGKRETVYKLFMKYESLKRRNRYFDECDVVFNLYQRLSKLDDVNWCIHQFYIDEVQDFTQAELTLLLHCCRWPNGLFLTGDTAQSIMRGVSFRFSDLRSVFHYINENVDQSRGQKTFVKVPPLHDLTQNFRSHSGILQLAASVIDLLMNFFISSLDVLPRDQGMFPGPMPVLLLSCEFSDLVLLLKGNRRESSAIEFGARQAIIVQSEEAKETVRKKIKAIVLTVFESKGLEFDDVVLYNFFTDSKVCM